MPRPLSQKITDQAELVLWALRHAQRPLTYPEIREYIYTHRKTYVENVAGRMGELRRLHRIQYTTTDDGARKYTYIGPLATPKTSAPMPRITLPEGFTPEQARRVKDAALREIARIQAETPAPAAPAAPAAKDWWDLDLFYDTPPATALRGVRR